MQQVLFLIMRTSQVHFSTIGSSMLVSVRQISRGPLSLETLPAPISQAQRLLMLIFQVTIQRNREFRLRSFIPPQIIKQGTCRALILAETICRVSIFRVDN